MLQAAGGLILVNGLRMVTLGRPNSRPPKKISAGEEPESQWKERSRSCRSPIPGTVGAGTIINEVVHAKTYTRWQDLLIISAVGLGPALLMWLTFRSSARIARRLGPIGLNIVTRVMGILVTATAFGLLARGIGGLLPGLMRAS